jgi:hypothetical protein
MMKAVECNSICSPPHCLPAPIISLTWVAVPVHLQRQSLTGGHNALWLYATSIMRCFPSHRPAFPALVTVLQMGHSLPSDYTQFLKRGALEGARIGRDVRFFD